MEHILEIFNSGTGAIQIYGIIILLLFAGAFGFPFPEDAVFLSVGYVAYKGVVDPLTAGIIGYIVVLSSDSVVYFLGNKLGKKVCNLPLLRTIITPEAIQKGSVLLKKNGPRFVFISKFIVGLRYTVFFVSGMMRIGFKRFLIFDALASAVTVSTLVSLAYFNGHRVDSIFLHVKNI
ncbi:MAG TPA: DedA family protein, partial [bacterium]|nr:DedA family protein [bacterium]